MENSTELYIDIDVKGNNHRITICHTESPCDAELLLDNEPTHPHLKTMYCGGAFFLQIDGEQVIITIEKKKEEFSYDCFIDGKSVQSGMPWKVVSMTVPVMTRWEHSRSTGHARYIISEIIKGILLGCVLFFILYFAENYTMFDNFHVTWKFLAFTVLPLGALYAVLSPIEWNRCEKCYAVFEPYRKNSDTPTQPENPDGSDAEQNL